MNDTSAYTNGLHGNVLFGNGKSEIDCTIRDEMHDVRSNMAISSTVNAPQGSIFVEDRTQIDRIRGG